MNNAHPTQIEYFSNNKTSAVKYNIMSMDVEMKFSDQIIDQCTLTFQ
jgi:hypothetical protein